MTIKRKKEMIINCYKRKEITRVEFIRLMHYIYIKERIKV